MPVIGKNAQHLRPVQLLPVRSALYGGCCAGSGRLQRALCGLHPGVHPPGWRAVAAAKLQGSCLLLQDALPPGGKQSGGSKCQGGRPVDRPEGNHWRLQGLLAAVECIAQCNGWSSLCHCPASGLGMCGARFNDQNNYTKHFLTASTAKSSLFLRWALNGISLVYITSE